MQYVENEFFGMQYSLDLQCVVNGDVEFGFDLKFAEIIANI